MCLGGQRVDARHTRRTPRALKTGRQLVRQELRTYQSVSGKPQLGSILEAVNPACRMRCAVL